MCFPRTQLLKALERKKRVVEMSERQLERSCRSISLRLCKKQIIRLEGASQRGKGVNVRVGVSRVGGEKKGIRLESHSVQRGRKRGSGDLAKSHPGTLRLRGLNPRERGLHQRCASAPLAFTMSERLVYVREAGEEKKSDGVTRTLPAPVVLLGKLIQLGFE